MLIPALLVLGLALAAPLPAQQSAPQSAQQPGQQPAQQSVQKLAFDVVSVRPSQPGTRPESNVPLGPGNVFPPTGGVLQAKGFTALTYLSFAYRLTDYQVEAIKSRLPDWLTQQSFNIEARTENLQVSKDQMRQMMQSLLADRFALAVHFEIREAPVYALLLEKPGVTGEKLQPHPASASCPDYSLATRTAEGNPLPEQPETAANGFPNFCGGILGLPASAQDRYSFGARNVSIGLIAGSFASWGNLGRPVVDRTGLTGAYDFVLDFTPDRRPGYATVESGGPSFQEALRKQLGLRLESQKAPVEFLILDHIDRPSAN